MTATTFAWLVVLIPLVGSIVIALGWRVLGGRAAGWIGSSAIGLSFACAIVALIDLQSRSPDDRHLT